MLNVAPYPHVVRLTSHHAQARTLDDFAALLKAHAGHGHCLFNGQLQQPLVDESRAGKTLKGAPREWVVFDFDKVEAKNAEEVVNTYLPEGCRKVSYVEQRSTSMFRPDAKVWSGHIFMQLKDAADEGILKGWFESLNFTVPALERALSLTESGIALHWPLDRTAAQDSKLIYIAPPKCHGFKPAIDAREAIRIVKKRTPLLSIPTFTKVDKTQIDARIGDLRTTAGLPARSLVTRRFEDGEVLVDAEPGTISDIRAMGDHYIKFNLNGGDSLGYWIDLRNPAVVKNFKGEPWLLTKDIDEKFYRKLAGVAPSAVAKPALDEGGEVLAFHATNEEATVRTGIWSPVDRMLRLDKSNLTAAGAWLATYGVIQRGHFPHCDVVFDTQSELQFVPGHPIINTFRRTDYMVRTRSKPQAALLTEIPPVINRTLRSMLGDPTEADLGQFINWLAAIFQTRKKIGTAWVLSGIEGTGKGKFLEFVLSPLFGKDVVTTVQFNLVKTDFNAYLERALIVAVNEADMNAVDNNADLMSKLLHWITDSPIAIHAKGRDPVQRDNFSNFIFYSNKRTPIAVSESNRRFNIANRQEQRLIYTPNEYLVLSRGEELDAFADVLQRWAVDEAALLRLVETDTAKLVHEQTTPINALVAEAIRQGDVEFFLDRMPSDAEAAGDFHGRFNPMGLFKALVDSILAGGHDYLTYEDMYVLFRTLIPDPRYFQDSKTWRMRHFHALGLECKRMRVPNGDARVYGIPVDWRVSAELKREHKKPKAKVGNNVIGIKTQRRARA
jgi:hypothetical protein